MATKKVVYSEANRWRLFLRAIGLEEATSLDFCPKGMLSGMILDEVKYAVPPCKKGEVNKIFDRWKNGHPGQRIDMPKWFTLTPAR